MVFHCVAVVHLGGPGNSGHWNILFSTLRGTLASDQAPEIKCSP